MIARTGIGISLKRALSEIIFSTVCVRAYTSVDFTDNIPELSEAGRIAAFLRY